MAINTEEIGKAIGYALIALAPYILDKVKVWLKKRGDYFSSNLRIRRQIDEIVKEIRMHMDCNRVLLYEFSNTDKSASGIPFEYINITYESLDNNVVSIKERYHKRHVTDVLFLLTPLDNESVEYCIHQNDDPLVSDDILFKMRHLSLSTMVVFKLNSQLKHGFIALHYSQPYMEDWTTTELRSRLHEHHTHLRFQSKRILQLMKQLKK